MASGGRSEMYMTRSQHVPASGGGWGGHTMSKSFTQLHMTGDSQRVGLQGPPAPIVAPQTAQHTSQRTAQRTALQTSTKERYVGTGPSQIRRQDEGRIVQPAPSRDAYSRDTLVRNHNVLSHRDNPGRPLVGGEGGGLRKWGNTSLLDNKDENQSRTIEVPTMPSQDQGFYTRGISYSTMNSPAPRPMLPFQSYQNPNRPLGKPEPQGATVKAKSVNTTDGRVHARMVEVSESRPDARPEVSHADMRLVGPGSPPPHSPVVLNPKARPISSPEGLMLDVELYIYDYIRHFCPNELNNIKNIYKLREVVQLKPEVPTLELTELITSFEKNLVRERIGVGQIPELRVLRQKLEEDFRAMLTPVNASTIEIVCERKHIDRLRSFIHTQSPSGPIITPVTMTTTSYQYASQPATESRSKFSPKGYLIYGMLKVYLHVCDITTLHTDMIVSAASPNLQPETGVARAIADAGGPALVGACSDLVQKLGPVPAGEIAQTTSGALLCGSVLHAVGPRWPAHPDPQQREATLQMLRNTYDNVMAFACTSGIETIAVPPISPGVYGVPHNFVTEAIYGALVTGVLNFFFHEENNLKELHVVDIEADALRGLDELFFNGCQAEGREVLRLLPDSATLTAVSSTKRPGEHRLPPLHLPHGSYPVPDLSPEYDASPAHLPQVDLDTQRETGDLRAGPILAAYVRNADDGPAFSPRGYLMFGMFRVFIHASNILDMEVDAIVHPGNAQLSQYSGEAVAIAMAAGPQMGSAIDEVLRARGSLPIGHVLNTPAGRLPCKSVLHVVVPQWPREPDDLLQRGCLEDLRKAFDNMMDHICRSGKQTVAIPVDPGLYQIPFPDVVETLYESIHYQLREHFFKSPNLREIHLVHESPNILMPFVELFEHDMRTSDARGASVSALDRDNVTEAWLKRNKTASLNAGLYQSLERQDAVRRPAQQSGNPVEGRREAITWGRDSDSAHSSQAIDATPSQPGSKKITIAQKTNNLFSCCYSSRKPPAKHQISVIEHPHYVEDRGQPTRRTEYISNGGPTETLTIHPRATQTGTQPYNHVSGGPSDHTLRARVPQSGPQYSEYTLQRQQRTHDQMADPSDFRQPRIMHDEAQYARAHHTMGPTAQPQHRESRGLPPNTSHQSHSDQPGDYSSLARPGPRGSQDLVVRRSYQTPAPVSPDQHNVRTANVETTQYNVRTAQTEREPGHYNVRTVQPDTQVNTVDRTSRAGHEVSRAPAGANNDVMPRGQPGASYQGSRNNMYQDSRYGRQSMPY